MHPALTFVPSDGSLRIDGCPIVIGPGLSLEDAAAGLTRFYRSAVDHQNGYRWLTFGAVSFGGHPCGFSLCFHQDRLTEVHWGAALPGETTEDGWPTRAAIDTEVQFIREILQKTFNRPFASGQERFPWGLVWSSFDTKGFCASAGVRYGR